MGNWQVRGMTLTLTLMLLTLGCSGNGSNMPVPKAYPVKGTVTVDGQPAGGVIVAFVNLSGSVKVFRVMATTNDNGEFELKAIGGGDGLANGDWAMTFSWPPPRKKNAPSELDADGKPIDKLNHKYEDHNETVKKFTVDGKLVDVGKIELTTAKGGT